MRFDRSCPAPGNADWTSAIHKATNGSKEISFRESVPATDIKLLTDVGDPNNPVVLRIEAKNKAGSMEVVGCCKLNPTTKESGKRHYERKL